MPEYVILEKQTFAIIEKPGSGTIEVPSASVREGWTPVLNRTAEEGPDGQPRVFTADDDDAAIDSYAENENGELVRPGTYRAVALRNWGEPVTLRPTTKTERIRGEG